ncbi:uncharacterized protein LOC114451908 [Parambassis ranga]|uniref:Uncharacterized protein LOC114451908 n=1 Tax=Parambassis ranga TaxID=210632 RepID=A0A6P7KB97_9TELE|nr:uncharacterized protein LOC114451908 [Parambassis ranga]XP_028286689.1 uncharacterized protein LOC114451908 [Parambassis ranga]
MDGGEPQAGCSQNFPKLPVWIIEHVWAHRMMEIQEVIAPSSWPDVDSQPLSLEDSWRLRVASAQVYSTVKSRNVELFERAASFLETTHRLLPRLVSAIKHMKIIFGLKTMVIMWMLKECRGMIDIMSKINQFFPSKLPQYQDQCSQHEMFLMRKNNLDFKNLAQSLTLDKQRRDEYVQNQMEEQYGERYAQKVEDRLLHYLHQLEATLPGETYIDKILRKQSPETEEEKLLLEVVTSDSITIAATLKRLLHCDVSSCRPAESAPPQRGEELSQRSQPVLSGSCQTEEAVRKVEVVSGQSAEDAASSPQFCSKHQRWVECILRECPDESSDELLFKANVSSSPPLFQSSSSSSSSQDLTPSDLIPLPPDQSPPQTCTHPQTAAQAPEDKRSSPEAPPLSTRNAPLPALLSPVVRLVDVASCRSYATFKPPNPNPPCHTSTDHCASSSIYLHPKPNTSSKPSLKSRHAASPQASTRNPAAEQADPAPSLSSQRTPQTHNSGPSLSETLLRSSAPPSVRKAPRRAALRLSLPSTSVLLQSKLLQPCVSLTRLSAEECRRVTEESTTARQSAEQEDTDSSFDINTLYSSGSSSSSNEDFQIDPDYNPGFKKKRLLLEYENARML